MGKWVIRLLLFILLTAAFVWVKPIFAESDLERLQRQIDEYSRQLTLLRSQANTLGNQIKQFDAQIKLTELKIDETQQQILLLGGRIDQLEVSLTSLTKAFSSRVVETYKMARFGEPFLLLATSKDIGEAVVRQNFLKRAQAADRELLVRLETAQNTYKNQKGELEKLEEKLETQRKELAGQKAAKAQLLAVTRNDEKRYQQLLAQAQAELEAIQSIIAGRGTETEVGTVGEGQRIASIIPTSSACSSGAHLHFEVAINKANQNPANYLQPKSIIWDNSPDGQFGFSGSWQWPVNDPIRITQGYGMTYYASVLKWYKGGPHTGIDMLNANNDLTVKSVRPGTLYRGGIACGGGTLRYVHIRQDNGLDTYYLHVNY